MLLGRNVKVVVLNHHGRGEQEHLEFRPRFAKARLTMLAEPLYRD